MTLQEEILTFWFGELAGPFDLGPNQKMWWVKDPAVDAQIQERFGAHVERGAAGEYDAWIEDPREALALVILLDQFSRNIYRQSPKTWASDPKAVALILDALGRGHHEALCTVERQFLFMPLLHSEDIAHHERVQALIAETLSGVPEEHRGGFEPWRGSAVQHANIVRRFGRYPHRNEILGRESTDEEQAFLNEPGSSF
jgi:uncharacterized protein (DUF924 family)